MQLIVPNGQGHNMWKGFFHCQELVDFVITHAKGKKSSSPEPELIWEGGDFTEGPAVGPDGSVLFSDVGADLIYKFSPKNEKVTTFRKSSGRANGLILYLRLAGILCLRNRGTLQNFGFPPNSWTN